MSLNPTQATGIAVFGIAALACTGVAVRRSSPPWSALALVQVAFTLEVLFGLRHRLHDSVDRLLRLHGWYAQRAGWQVGILVAGALLTGAASAALARRAPANGSYAGSVAAAATLGASLLFGVEIVSLHGTDAWLYAMAGPVLRIAWVWSALSGVVVVGAVTAALPSV